MRRSPLLILLLLAMALRAEAQPPATGLLSLADSSTLVVIGQVGGVTVRGDAGAIYTYATVNVSEVVKGELAGPTIVVKQLGGTLPGLGLYIADQATFAAGEDVLLFLGVRPRDGTLYTVGLSLGKWRVLPDLRSRVGPIVVRVPRFGAAGGGRAHPISGAVAHGDRVAGERARSGVLGVGDA